MAVSDDKFTVFISHKHDDHALAVKVKDAIESLNREVIDCFVSDIDITAGMDWRREIRSALARSHMLLLLFTAPSKNWDWCLYETGLYTRFDKADVRAVVCLFNPGQAAPSPLADLQGVPADADKIRGFLTPLCQRTWTISDDWRRGPLAPGIEEETVKEAAAAIADAFRRSGSISAYYPCHRVVLSLSDSDDVTAGIPETARVMEGPNDTSGYTMSLFDLAGGTGRRTWRDLLLAVDGIDAPWRHELDAQFLLALGEKLFAPTAGRLRTGRAARVGDRPYHPVIYSIDRGPALESESNDVVAADRRPRSVTIVLAPEPDPSREVT
jgi:TIR domain-containing protein